MTLGHLIRTRLWLGLIGLGIALAPVYARSEPRIEATAMIGLSVLAGAAILAGIRMHRPAGGAAWLLLAAVQLTWTVAWVLWEGHILESGIPPATSSSINFFFLAGYPGLAAAFIFQLRRRERDTIGPIDVGIIGLALGMLTWVLLAVRYTGDGSVPALGRGVQISYALLDVLVLASLLRVLTSPGRRSPAFWLLVLGATTWLASDAIWNWSTELGSYSPGSWADVGWLLSNVFIGAAALHPSAKILFRREKPVDRRLRWDRVAFIVAASLVGPALLANIGTLAGQPGEVIPVAIATILVVLLVVARLAITLREAETLTAKLRRRNERLRELDRMKDDFVASVSHELRTPLTSIRGYIELVLDDDAGHVTEDQRRFLSVVDRNSERLLHLVGDLLFVAQVDREQLALQLNDVELATIAAHSVEGLRPRAAELELTLVLAADDVPPIRGDRARLAQLVDNLVSNALKFTPAGGRVDVRLQAGEESVVLEVADTGIGISAEDRSRLFERFFRTDGALERAIQGTGLGLSIAKAIVEAHGGRIEVESEEGRGTSFRVELPVRVAEGAARPAAERRSQEVHA